MLERVCPWLAKVGFRYARTLALIAVVSLHGIAAAQTWSERGPVLGGRLTAIVPATGDRNILLASSPGGGVWRSTNGGGSWSFPANSGLGDYSVVHLERDVMAPGRIYALTWNSLYVTTDNANSWTALINTGAMPAPLQPSQSAVADPKPFTQMRFSPTQKTVLAALPCSGLYYSFDGVHFTQNWPFSGGSGNLDNCIGTIAADPVAGRVYFSTLARDPFGAAHVFRSNCPPPHKWQAGTPCLTWQKANGGLPSNSIIASIISLSGGPVIAQTTGTGSATSTYTSPDGLAWTLQSTTPTTWSPRTLVYGGSGKELFQGNLVAYYSPDLGVHWNHFSVPNEHPDVRGVYADASARKLFTVTDGSMEGSYANVTRWNWTPGSPPSAGVNLGHSGLKVWQTYFAGVVPSSAGARADARRVFVGSQDNASLCSDSLGLSAWTTSGAPPGGGSGDQFAFASAPSDANRAYGWSGETVTFAMSSNAGSAANCAAVVWKQITPTNTPAGKQLVPPVFWSHHAVAVHPTSRDRLYFAFLLDMGEVANASIPAPVVVHHALPNNYNPTAIYVDASGAIYVGTADHGAYKSPDDGASWSAWGPGPAPLPALVTAITSSGGPHPATFWMATTNGLYKKIGAGPWALTTGDAGYTISDVAVDPSCPTRVYAAYGFAGTRGQHRGGIEVTSDNGATWASITSGQDIHQGPVTQVEVDPQQPASVYAASYGRGFWVYNWGNKLPACRP
jgi:hypothetical protein